MYSCIRWLLDILDWRTFRMFIYIFTCSLKWFASFSSLLGSSMSQFLIFRSSLLLKTFFKMGKSLLLDDILMLNWFKRDCLIPLSLDFPSRMSLTTTWPRIRRWLSLCEPSSTTTRSYWTRSKLACDVKIAAIF